MKMTELFDTYWETLNFGELSRQIQNYTAKDVEVILSKSSLTVNDLPPLLSKAAGAYLEEMALRSATVTRERFGNTMQIYAPLYLSNECGNGCLYCGFSAQNKKIVRRTLTLEEAEAEFIAINEMGIRHVLLVCGEAPAKTSLKYLKEVAAIGCRYTSNQGVEIYPMDTEGYSELVESGIDGLTVFQETYEPVRYAELHPLGRKKDIRWRLNAPDRGGAAGMRSLGLGALLGLSDPRTDMLFTALHASYLSKKYWRSHITISLPRMRPAEGSIFQPMPVSDRLYVQFIAALRLTLPDTGIAVSTRERAEFRDNLVGLGVTQMSAASATEPGGYTTKNRSTAQFEVEDHRSVPEFIKMLKDKGCDPVMKDWDAGLKTGI